MRVLFIISTLDTGGAQRALSNIVCNLPSSWDIDILLNNTENINYPYHGNLLNLSIKIPTNRDNFIYLFKVLIKRIYMLRKLKRKRLYNACISFLESANLANVLSGRKYCKIILSTRNCLSKDKSFAGKCSRFVAKHCYKHANHIVAVSKGVENDLLHILKINKNNVTTICKMLYVRYLTLQVLLIMMSIGAARMLMKYYNHTMTGLLFAFLLNHGRYRGFFGSFLNLRICCYLQLSKILI